MMRFVVSTCLFITLVAGQSTEVSQCTVNSGELPINTYIEGCTRPPCSLPQLKDAVINISFRAPRNITKMKTLATAYLLFIPIPYDLEENAETCNFLENTNCPLQEGDEVQYSLRMYIESYFPVGTSVTIEFRVVDENNDAVLCIRVPVRITTPV